MKTLVLKPTEEVKTRLAERKLQWTELAGRLMVNVPIRMTERKLLERRSIYVVKN